MNSVRALVLFILLYPIQVYAAEIRCPTVAEIKNNQLDGWLLLYKQYEEMASLNDMEKFRQHVVHFKKAEWGRAYLENGRCIYGGTDSVFEQIILAHDAWRPTPSEGWRWVTESLAECGENEAVCRFII